MYYYEVAPIKIVRAGSDTFTYHSSDQLAPGQVVTIPVGKQLLTGVVMRYTQRPGYETKEVMMTCPELTLPEQLITTAQWMSSYYATPLATVFQTMLPRGITKKRRAIRSAAVVPNRIRTNFVLNEEQLLAVDELSGMSPGTAILHGITGSGKTAVYIELTRRALAQNNSVIVLVPEIALTSQLVAEFTHYFDDIIVTHSQQTESERHSAWLKALHSTRPCVIIGPRSALFMPALRISCIIIDEAHEPSYKQEQAPRYSALRVASVLMEQVGGKVIQGTATPLITEYYFAQQAKRPIIVMNQKARVGTIQPNITLIDMTQKTQFTRHRFISDKLLDAISSTLSCGDQVLIYHNRRGSANTTLCEQCGWSAVCPRCFIPYTLHADLHTLRCHVCDLRERIPTNCPTCQSTDIIHKGIGTKLIETELRRLFPKCTIARFDGDTSSAETLDKRYGEIYSGHIDIMVGTQVVAKGLDLPKLRVVGVIQADAGLALPDYASSERTFQLLAQVIGRVGRTPEKSTVIIQSYQPLAPAIQLGIAQQYSEFSEATLNERRQAHFPPFSYLLKLTCAYRTEAAAIRNAKQLATKLSAQHGSHIRILGPSPAFYERRHDTYRWQLVIRSPRRQVLADIASSVTPPWQADLDPTSLL